MSRVAPRRPRKDKVTVLDSYPAQNQVPFPRGSCQCERTSQKTKDSGVDGNGGAFVPFSLRTRKHGSQRAVPASPSPASRTIVRRTSLCVQETLPGRWCFRRCLCPKRPAPAACTAVGRGVEIAHLQHVTSRRDAGLTGLVRCRKRRSRSSSAKSALPRVLCDRVAMCHSDDIVAGAASG